MSERSIESLNGLGVQDIAPQTDGVKDLTKEEILKLPIKDFEKRLDGIFGEKESETGLNEVTQPKRENPEKDGTSFAERLTAAAVIGPLLFGAGVAFSPTEAKAGTAMVSPSGMPSQAALAEYGIDTETDQNSTPAVGMSEPTEAPTPSIEDAEYTATIKALESLGYSTEHYAERQRKINEYKRQLVEYAGENINLEACANLIYRIKKSTGFSVDGVIHLEKTVIGNYVTVDEVFEVYKTSKFKKGSNLRGIFYKDEKGNPTNEIGLFSVVNPKTKTMSVDAISGVIDEWEDISPGFLRTFNANNGWGVFQSDAGGDQGPKYDDVMIYLNYSSKGTDAFRSALPVEQFGIRCEALGGEFFADKMDALLKPRFVLLCCNNLLSTVDKEYIGYIEYLYKRFQVERDTYTGWFLGGRSLDYVNNLVTEAKSKNIFTSFGGTWPEIDAANVVNAVAKTE